MHEHAWNSTLRKPRKPMNKVGPRTKKWIEVWRWLRPRMEAAGRKRCEFGFIPHDCDGSKTPAHSKKRRNMRGNDIYAVAWACLTVHRILDEQMSHEEMEAAVMRAIKNGGGLILPESLIVTVGEETEFHVLFNTEGGSVQECVITASCLLECEDKLRELHPEAAHWEIGI